MKKRSILALTLSLTLALSMFLGGCGSAETSSEEAKAAEEETEEEVLKNIGTEAEGENIYKVVLENKTGKDIVGFSIKDSSMTEYPASMLETGDVFADGEKRNLFYDSASAVEAAEAQAAASGEDTKALEPQMDIQLTFDDQTSLVLSAFPFGDVEEAQICLEDEVAFIEYESLASKETMSTKEAELTVKAEAEAAAAAQAQAEAEAAAAAQAQAQAEAARQQQAAQQQQTAPSTSGDGCVNGGLVY